MKTKPFYLKIFPFLVAGLAFSFPLQIHLIYDIPLTDPVKLISMLTPLNLITVSMLVLTGVLTLTLSKYVYKFIPILLFIVFANNAIVGLYGTDYTLLQVAFSFVLFGLSLRPFYSPEIKAVIMNPNFRWWETPTRYQMQRPLQLQADSVDIFSESLNLSSTGLFAKIKEPELMEALNIDDIIDIKILDDKPITMRAKVVRKADDNNQGDEGYGLQFIQDAAHKKQYLPWFKETTSTMSL